MINRDIWDTSVNWYSPDTVARKWKRQHVIFVCHFLMEILTGFWPPDNRNTKDGISPAGKVPTIKKKRTYQAEAENIVSIGVALENKLARAGRDSLLVTGHYTLDMSYEYLAKCLRVSEKEVMQRIDGVLNYVSGKK